MCVRGLRPATGQHRIGMKHEPPRAGSHFGTQGKLATTAGRGGGKARADFLGDLGNAIIRAAINNDEFADQAALQPLGQRAKGRADAGGGIEGGNDDRYGGGHGCFRAGNGGACAYITPMSKGYHDKTRQLLRISGADRQDFLQGLVSNDVKKLGEGAIYAAMLSPQGKYLFDFFLSAEDDAILIDVAAGRAAALAQRLTMYRLRADVVIEPLERAVWRGIGKPPQGALDDPRHAAMGWRFYGDLEIDPLPEDHFEAARIEHLIPEAELVENETYILEAGFERLNGVDFRKGCYVGQEITARMKHKTELKKGLRRVAVAGNAPFGTTITAGGKPAGTLFSVVAGQGIAHLRFDRATGEMQAGAALLRLI